MHISGGQLNPAVTFGLVCSGHITVMEALRCWIAQLLAGVRPLSSVICLRAT